jgi:murein DD-endopeptidase MepM/ murein hydrolase activator NlpD
MAAVKGTPVMAAAHGVVTQAHHSGRFGKHAGGFGNFVVIRHTNQLTTRYAHLDSVRVKNGQKVHAGTVIGTVGETGHIRKKTKDGSHLHFELFQYNRRVNPLTLLPPIP